MLRDAQVSKRVGQRQLVAGLLGEIVGTLKSGNSSAVVVPDHLMEDANPEQRFALAAHIPEHLIELSRPLEQHQFVRILVSLLKESRMNDPAAR
jgi:antitoxin component of MazEF toxin-antitoxin module